MSSTHQPVIPAARGRRQDRPDQRARCSTVSSCGPPSRRQPARADPRIGADPAWWPRSWTRPAVRGRPGGPGIGLHQDRGGQRVRRPRSGDRGRAGGRSRTSRGCSSWPTRPRWRPWPRPSGPGRHPDPRAARRAAGRGGRRPGGCRRPGGRAHASLHRELELLVAADLPAADVQRAATEAGQVFGWPTGAGSSPACGLRSRSSSTAARCADHARPPARFAASGVMASRCTRAREKAGTHAHCHRQPAARPDPGRRRDRRARRQRRPVRPGRRPRSTRAGRSSPPGPVIARPARSGPVRGRGPGLAVPGAAPGVRHRAELQRARGRVRVRAARRRSRRCSPSSRPASPARPARSRCRRAVTPTGRSSSSSSSGRAPRQVAAADAWRHVAGLTVGQDVSERITAAGRPRRRSSAWASRYPGFGPVGPWLVTPDEFDDPDDLELGCSINGEQMQKGRTSDLIFGGARADRAAVAGHAAAARRRHLHRHAQRASAWAAARSAGSPPATC